MCEAIRVFNGISQLSCFVMLRVTEEAQRPKCSCHKLAHDFLSDCDVRTADLGMESKGVLIETVGGN
jgi:hypothetical protein